MIFVLLLLGVYAGTYVRPEALPILSLFNYIYPFVLVINSLFCVLWLFIKWKFLFVPLATILLGFDFIPRFIGFSSEELPKDELKTLKVTTYNVGSFAYETQNTSELRNRNMDSILNIITTENPDIVCFQEYSSSKKGQQSFHRKMIKDLNYEYYFAPSESKQHISGNVIYSKYKINRSGCPFPMKENFRDYSFIDIKPWKESLRIYNVHLTSYKMTEEEKSKIGDIRSGKISDKETSLSVKDKLIRANIERSKDTRQIVDLLNQTKQRYILVGDMNSTPYSYTYQEFTKLTNDSFVKVGNGFSGTYNGPLPAYRIDYVFCGDGIKPLTYLCSDKTYSDHKPVTVSFEFEKTE